MKWIGRAAAAAAIISAAAFGGWACGDDGGGELTLEEYFQKLDEAENDFSAKGEELDTAFEAEEPTIEEAEDAISEFAGVLEDFVGELEDLEAPEEAAAAHDEAVTTGRAATDAWNDLADRIGDAESVEEIFTGEAGDALFVAMDEFSAACTDLQTIADDNNIEVDLACEDSET